MGALWKKLLAASESGGNSPVTIDGAEFDTAYLGSYDAFLVNDTTFGTPTNNKKMTIAFWVSRFADPDTFNGGSVSLYKGTDGIALAVFVTSDGLQVFITDFINAQEYNAFSELQVADEVPAFVMVSIDTTQATLAGRIKVWFGYEGAAVADVTSDLVVDPAGTLLQDAIIDADEVYINSFAGIATFEGTTGDVHFIDGQAIADPSAFVANYTTAAKPGTYTGSYGNNGFHLDFSNSGDLGNDSSGNNHDFTLDVDPGATLTHIDSWITP